VYVESDIPKTMVRVLSQKIRKWLVWCERRPGRGGDLCLEIQESRE